MRRLITILAFLACQLTQGQQLFFELNQNKSVASNAFVTEWVIPSNGYTLSIPFANVTGGTYDGTIDWGDGNFTALSASTLSHTYSTSGTYQISISGECPQINFASKTELSAITSWGNIRVRSFSCNGAASLTSLPVSSSSTFFSLVTTLANAFRQTAITSVPTGIFNSATGVSSYLQCFYLCTSLTSIPAGLFDYSTGATNFQQLFFGCPLTSIPAGLFDYNTMATTFAYAFQSSHITSIPSGLFDHTPNVNTFQQTFYGCASLASIPTGLFDHTTSVTSFNSTFRGCTSLTTVPSTLFSMTTSANDFTRTFYGCTAITSTVPTLWTSYPSATHTQCFYNCLTASNYADIPADWK